MPVSERFELFLIKSKEDGDIFSSEYQKELSEFSKGAHADSQICFAMDSAVGGGGPLGEFIFNNAVPLITALTTVACVWIKARSGRKIRIKIKDTEIEANSVEELKGAIEQIKLLQKKP
jgi:hypothetical protein